LAQLIAAAANAPAWLLDASANGLADGCVELEARQVVVVVVRPAWSLDF
jgi:hypothetical protein